MNKICIIAKNKKTYFITKLIEKVGKEVVLFDPWTDMLLPEADKYVVRTTGVYGTDLDLLILNTLPSEKILNPLETLKIFRTKNTQYSWFEDNDLPILPWISLQDTNLITVEKFFRLYPFCVVKPLVGQGGWGVETLTWESFRTWKKKKGNDTSYLLQPLVRDAKEFRYFFMKNRGALILERKAKSGIVANFQRGGEAVLSSLPEEFKNKLDRIVSLSGAQYGAIDLFIDEKGMNILELNTVPGFEQIEKISEQDLVEDFIKMIHC